MASYDTYVNIEFKDASGVLLGDLPLSTGMQVLAPIFASKGLDNKCQVFTSLSSFLNEYGEDALNLDLYGQQGLNAKQALSGGGTVHACRLLPANAKSSSVVFQVWIKEESNIQIYKRNSFGGFFLDNEGNKVPLTEEIENEEGEMETVPVTKDGFRIKLVAVEAKNDTMDGVIKTESGDWKVFPLFKFHSLTRGTCGNFKGFAVMNDYRRDMTVSDGRRYELQFYSSTDKGIVEMDPITYSFAFNPDAVLSAGSTRSDALDMVYENLDREKYYDPRQMQLTYYSKNYLSLVETLATRASMKPFDIDFITCTDKETNAYDTIFLDEESLDMRERVIFLKGGHDGSLQVGNKVQGTEGEIEVTEEIVEETKKDLLKKFFNGEIDEDLRDCRLVSAGVIFDANYDLATKGSMASDLPKIREDIFVFLDCNHPITYTDAIRTAADIRGRLNTAEAQHAIYPHAGICVNQTKQYRVTQTYEMAYMFPAMYKANRPYCIVGGFDTGRVKTMLPDFTIQGEIQTRQMKNANLNYITKLSNSGNSDTTANGLRPYYVMEENTQYSAPLGNSAMLSVRNALVVTDYKRLARIILPKHSFKENAETAMSGAAAEMLANQKERYPSDIIFETEFKQSDRDKVLENCSVYTTIRFPGIIKGWNVYITAKRVGQE